MPLAEDEASVGNASGRKRFLFTSSGYLQAWVLVAALAALLFPNVALCFTEPYFWTTMLASLLLPCGGYVFWALFLHRPGYALWGLFPFMFLAAFQLVVMYLFNGSCIATDMFTNLFTTSVSEAGELLGNILPAVLFVCLLYIPLLVLAGYLTHKKTEFSQTQKLMGLRIAIVTLASGFVFAGISEWRNSAFSLHHHVFPANVLYNAGFSLWNKSKSDSFHTTSHDFRFDPHRASYPVPLQDDSVSGRLCGKKPREIYVFVIGEASRAASWELLGYERPTTPLLAKEDGVVPFYDFLTESNTTHKSVPVILSPCSAENYDSIYQRKSLLTLYKEAGFRTAYISNEPPNRSLIDFFASEADTLIRIVPSSSKPTSGQPYDGEILPHLERILQATEDDLFVVLHTYGSHFAYHERYPREFARFLPDNAPAANPRYKERMRNAYDNSVLYTDFVLHRVIQSLRATGACTALFYNADHGEDLIDDSRGRFLHASPTTTYYQLHIAAFAWFSPAYRMAWPGRYEVARQHSRMPASTANTFPTVADLAALRSPWHDERRSLLSPDFEVRMRYYLDDHNEAIPFTHSGLEEEDFEQLHKHKIRYDADRAHFKTY